MIAACGGDDGHHSITGGDKIIAKGLLDEEQLNERKRPASTALR
jgi:hypothetical protein